MTLVERADELDALHAQWDRACAGRGGLVVVSGEPGAGKTVLVESFLASLADDLPRLWGACDPLSTPRPLGPVHDMADQLGEPVHTLLRDAEQPHEIFAGVFERLRAEPTIAVVDDLHWADQGTIDLLRFALRRLRTTRSLVIVTLRADEIGPAHAVRSLLGDVARSPDATLIALPPLTVSGVATLVGERPIDPTRLHHITGGNPFFLVEMLDHAGDQLPTTVRDAILARTAALDDDAWDVLHLLTCAPEAIPDQLLAGLGVTLPPLRALDAAGLIRRGSRGVDFRHDLCRLAIVGSIPPGGEVSLHRRMLDVLEQSAGADATVLAHHARGAGDGPRILRYASEAARTASRSGARTQAAALYRLALQQQPASPELEAELLERLAVECYLLDHLDEAIEAGERAMALRGALGDLEAVSANHHALAVYEWYNANRSNAEHHVAEAIAVLDGATTSAPTMLTCLGHALAMQGYLTMQAGDLERARALISSAAEIAATTGDHALGVRTGLIRGTCAVLAGEQDGRESMLSILGSVTDELFDEIHSSGYSNLTYLDVEQRRLTQAGQLLELSLPLTIERDLPVCHAWQLGSRSRLQLLLGRWDDAHADADTVLAGPSAPLARTWPLLVRGLITLRRSGEATIDLDAAWDLAKRYGEPIRLLPAAAALVEQAWLLGRPDRRIQEARALLDAPPSEGSEWARGELAGWLRRLDRDERVPSEQAGTVDGVAEPYRLQAAGEFAAAADTWARLESQYELAFALVETFDTDRARDGLDILDRIGADAVAAKLRRELRSAGMIGVPAPRRRSTRTNPAGLTAREIEVIGLLEEGLTNAEIGERLFLSRKTVDHHVSAILTKLGVANRREAVRQARRDGIVA